MARRNPNRHFRPKHIKKFADRMRHRLTSKELMFLRRLTLGNVADFDFQVRIGFYVADFVFPSKMLIIELDGPNHDPEHDAKRDAWLALAGFTTWRIPNSEAALWPLSTITKHERPPEGRNYIDAVRWANARHDAATAHASGKTPQPRPKEERREEFYKRLIAKTNQVQEQERKRKEAYAEERRVRAEKRGKSDLVIWQ